jgi:hypothetical protein
MIHLNYIKREILTSIIPIILHDHTDLHSYCWRMLRREQRPGYSMEVTFHFFWGKQSKNTKNRQQLLKVKQFGYEMVFFMNKTHSRWYKI